MSVFTTTCGHSGTIKPVQKKGGAKEGTWISRVSGPKVTGASGVKSMYSAPDMESTKQKIAHFLAISSLSILVAGNALSHAPSTPPRPVKREATLGTALRTLGTTLGTIATSMHKAGTQNQLDKYEASPNGMAKCCACQTKIERGSHRIGKWTYLPSYEKYQYVYWHDSCAPAHVTTGLCLPTSPTPNASRNMDSVLQTELAHQLEEKVKQHKVVFEDRSNLREALCRLRTLFAQRLKVAPYCIFDNTTLDEIVYKLPKTKQDLFDCRGIAEKRSNNFGPAILQVVDRYWYQQQGKRPAQHRANSPNDDSPVLVTESLTCEQIVDRRFNEAAMSGEVVSID